MDVEPSSTATRAKLPSIQYLRAIAALLVVFHHAHNDTAWLVNPLARFVADARGVDLFFVISGFVMYAAARTENAGDFIIRRLTRIVPLYWLATFGFVLLSGRFSVLPLAKSLFFIPYYSPDHVGEIWPVLIPGWTLNFEMFFYAVFALALLSRHLLPVLILVIVTLVIAGFFHPATNALWRVYTSPMLLEFLGGVLIALAFERANRRQKVWRWLALLLPFAAVALLASDFTPLPLIIGVGIPAVMIVAGAVGLEVTGRVPDLPALRLIGDASYAIYLTHLIVIGFCGIAIQASGLVGTLQFVAMLTLSMIVSTVVGIGVHRTIEKPILQFLNRQIRPSASGARQPIPAH